MEMRPADRVAFRTQIGPLLEEAVVAVAAFRDPGEREAATATLLPRSLLDAPDELVGEALDVVAEAPRGPELLAGMSVAAPTRIALGARARLEELEDAPAPLGALSVKEAWEMVADEPVTGLFALCTRAGERGAQLFSFTVEEILSGDAIKDGFVTGMREGTRLVKALRTQLPEEVELRTIEAVEAAERIVAAAEQGARTGFAPTPDGLAAATIFLRASGADDADALVQGLELGEVLADRTDELEEEAAMRAVDELAAIAEGWLAGRGHADERVQAGRYAAELMGDFRVSYLGGDLMGWQADELDEFLLDWMPRRIPLEDDEIEGFPAAVVDVLTFLGATRRLPERRARTLAARATRRAARFVQVMTDPSMAGPAGALVEAMLAEGVEPADPEALAAWFEDFNSRPQEERERIVGASLERLAAAPASPKPRKKAKARKVQRQARKRNRGR